MNPIALIVFLFLSVSAFAQDVDLDKISRALGEGNAENLALHFNRSVEIMINGEGTVLSRNEARERVAGFFSENKITGFSIVHKGTAKGNASNYCIGDLKTLGKTVRVYIYMKPSPSAEGDLRIVELRFDS